MHAIDCGKKFYPKNSFLRIRHEPILDSGPIAVCVCQTAAVSKSFFDCNLLHSL